jgi:hypothetical protein
MENVTMKVSELIGRLQACNLDAEVFLQDDRSMFASATRAGIMNTADLLAKESEYPLVISPWERTDDLKPSADQEQARMNS